MAQGKWLARLLAALLSVGCLLLSLVLASKIGFVGFAIGGWTGLKGYEQAIVNARHMAYVSMAQVAALQLIGGIIVFLGFRRKLGLAVAAIQDEPSRVTSKERHVRPSRSGHWAAPPPALF